MIPSTIAGMRDFAVLFVHLIVTLARLAEPGGLRSVVAESVLVLGRGGGAILYRCRITIAGRPPAGSTDAH
jgi:hypothetical protein